MPRAIQAEAGRPNSEQFLKSKEFVTTEMLEEDIYVWKSQPLDDGAGAYEPNWVKNWEVRKALFEGYKRDKPIEVFGGKIEEFLDTVIYVEVGIEVDGPDRVERISDGTMWEVISRVGRRSGEPTIMLWAKQVE